MASRGATNPSTTTRTHQPHSTRVYHHTIIVQPNTVNREGRAGEGGNIDTEQVGSKGREGEYDNRMKKPISSTLTLATDVYTTTPSTTTTRHSHCLLNLDSIEKDGGIKQTGGRAREQRHPWGRRPVLNTNMEAVEIGTRSRSVRSLSLVGLHDSLTDSNRSSHSGPDSFEESVLQKFLALSLFLHQMPLHHNSFLQYESESNPLKTKSKLSFFPKFSKGLCVFVCKMFICLHFGLCSQSLPGLANKHKQSENIIIL